MAWLVLVWVTPAPVCAESAERNLKRVPVPARATRANTERWETKRTHLRATAAGFGKGDTHGFSRYTGNSLKFPNGRIGRNDVAATT